MEMSPSVKNEPRLLTFSEALIEMIAGKKVTKKEWNNSDYGFMKDELLHIHREKDHAWFLSRADVEGEDYFIL